MIDVQLLTLGNENPAWVAKCLVGLNSPVVTIKRGEGIKGNINAARIANWDTTTGNLMSFVDPDDVPDAAIWQQLQDVMDQNPTALGVYCLESLIDHAGRIVGTQLPSGGIDPVASTRVAHHILVVRRQVYNFVRPYALMKRSAINWMLACAAFHQGGLICLPKVGYQWRQSPHSTGRTVSDGPGLIKDFMAWSAVQPKIVL